MARQSQQINLESFADMAAHLDRWAGSSLTTPSAWEKSLIGPQPWLDNSGLGDQTTAYSIDTVVGAFAESRECSRRQLAVLLGQRLGEPERERLATAEPGELVELLGAAGLSAGATIAVLHAERVEADTVTGLLPTLGVPTADAIRVLHRHWDVPNPDAAVALEATAAEMRDAGCTAIEIMATRPRDVLRALPQDTHVWELAAGTMATAGHSPNTIAGHLVAHAPTLDAFAAGIATGIDDPTTGLTLAARHGATPDQLAGASEAYGLSPTDTATVLVDAGTQPGLVLDTLDVRCDHDTDTALTIATDAGIGHDSINTWLNPAPLPVAVSSRRAVGDDDCAALLATLPPPGPSLELDPTRLLDTLTGIEPKHIEALYR